MRISVHASAAAAAAASTVSAAALGAYNVDPSSVSVSGISAGGFMSVQLGVAYSDVFATGFGVFAGGPFDCARDQSYLLCSDDQVPSITQPTANMRAWSGTSIAPVSALELRRIFMQVGSLDTVVGANVMAQLRSQLANFDDAANTTFVTTPGAEHTFPTDFYAAGDNACAEALSPFISNCGYDGAGAVLQWMYGSLSARNNGAPTGSVIAFDQAGSYGAAGLDHTGYVYVPQACQDGATACRLHVALHGCAMSHDLIGDKFITNAGYTKWADTNNIIVLYPQAVVDLTLHSVWGGLEAPNPYACFDWIGWYGQDADQIGGVQMTAIINMVQQIISG